MTRARCWAEESVKDTLTDSAVSSHYKSSLPSEIETGFLELGFWGRREGLCCLLYTSDAADER